MDARISPDGSQVVVGNLPTGTAAIALYVNGVRCHRAVTGSESAGCAIAMRDLNDSCLPPAPRAPGLVQCYALGADGAALARCDLHDAPLSVVPTTRGRAPVPRAAAAASGPQPNRLVASTLHAGGDCHRWEFTVGALPTAGPPVTGPGAVTLAYLRVLFDTEPAGGDAAAGALSLATVQWTVLPGAGAPTPPGARIRTPTRTAWGTPRSSTAVSAACPDSAFVTMLSTPAEAAVLRCEIALAPDAGPLRYAVYGLSQAGLRLPPLLPGEEAEGERGGVAAPPPPVGRRLAVLVGVSKYKRRPQKRISDLEYADDDVQGTFGMNRNQVFPDDVVQWWHYLRGLGYECTVLGDEFSTAAQCEACPA